MPGRVSNKPKPRIATANRCTAYEKLALLNALTYVGSAHHKRRPGDYGFHPPTNPRPHKSLCDGDREVLLEEAAALMRRGIAAGMFSDFAAGGVPKYVWSVSDMAEVFEAKTNPLRERSYHGYRLDDDDEMKHVVL